MSNNTHPNEDTECVVDDCDREAAYLAAIVEDGCRFPVCETHAQELTKISTDQ